MAVPAAAAPTDLSVLSDDATEWAEPDPGYLNIMAEVGGANADNRDATVLKLINLSARSPVVPAFTLASDPDHIWVGHSLTHYPTDILAATPSDNGAMVLVGQDAHRTVPISPARDASGRTSQTRALRSGAITGDTLLTAAPPVLRSGPHGAGTADSDLLAARRVCLLPSDIAGTAIAASPSGRFSYTGFYNTPLRAKMTSGDVNREAKYTPLDGWSRLVCTSGRNAAPAGPPLSVLAVGTQDAASPVDTAAMNAWHSTVEGAALRRLGMGGPALSEAASVRGVGELVTTVTDNHTARLQSERDRDNQTFAQEHGDALCQRVMDLTGQDNGANFPDVHKLLVKSTESREYGVLHSLLVERAVASTVPLTATNAPDSQLYPPLGVGEGTWP